ncbi:hypothetical protein GCM10020220_003880 [Nonomuraea rubra]
MPWSWTARTPDASAAARTVSRVLAAEDADGEHVRGHLRRASEAARSGVIRRGLLVMTNPIASAPASTAVATCSGSLSPQIFTYTPPTLAAAGGCRGPRHTHSTAVIRPEQGHPGRQVRPERTAR